MTILTFLGLLVLLFLLFIFQAFGLVFGLNLLLPLLGLNTLPYNIESIVGAMFIIAVLTGTR